MRCPACGFDNPDDHRFCGRCGNDFAAPSAPFASPTPGQDWTVALVPTPRHPGMPGAPGGPPVGPWGTGPAASSPPGPLAPPAPRAPLSSTAIAVIALAIVFALAIAGVVIGQLSTGL